MVGWFLGWLRGGADKDTGQKKVFFFFFKIKDKLNSGLKTVVMQSRERKRVEFFHTT
jgi:hypothetical protein